MPEQQQPQKDTQSKQPPNVSGTVDKTASGKPGMKKQDQKQKTGSMDEDEETSGCGPGSCG